MRGPDGAGPERAGTALRSCLAVGADRAIHLKADALERTDALGTARALAALLKTVPYDLVLFGRYAVGTDQNAVGVMVNTPATESMERPKLFAVSGMRENGRGEEGRWSTILSIVPIAFRSRSPARFRMCHRSSSDRQVTRTSDLRFHIPGASQVSEDGFC